jgi:hypothetical protein
MSRSCRGARGQHKNAQTNHNTVKAIIRLPEMIATQVAT